MVLNVSISPEIEAKLKAKAAIGGFDVQTFVAVTLERAVSRPDLAEVLAPLRAEFDASGMNEDDLVKLLETAKHEMRAH
jgi:hypothetical protein